MRLSVVHVIGTSIIGGAECHFVDLIEGLSQTGVANLAICPRPGPLAELLYSRGIAVELIEMLRPEPDGTDALDPAAFQKILRLLKSTKPRVVHSHLYPANFLASLAAHEAHVPAIIQTKHGFDMDPEEGKLSKKTALYTIAVARAIAKDVENAGIAPDRIEVIYNCAGPTHFDVSLKEINDLRTELDLDAGPLVGTVARLAQVKGVDIFLKAVQLAKRTISPLTAIVVGDGPQSAELHALAQELDINNAVRFFGLRKDTPALNRLLDVVVLASRKEACSLALLEAMAAGRTVIATAVGGTPEIITHGVNGWLVPPEDPTALAQAIITLLSNSALRTSLGTAAQNYVSMYFTREQMIQNVLSFYQRILSRTVLT